MSSDEQIRASDSERDATIKILQQAHAEGRLSDEESTDRIGKAIQAGTRGQLAALTNDLPHSDLPKMQPAGLAQTPDSSPVRQERPGGMSQTLKAGWASWAGVGVLMIVIWALTGAGGSPPWFLWVVGPWGAVMLMATITERVNGPDD